MRLCLLGMNSLWCWNQLCYFIAMRYLFRRQCRIIVIIVAWVWTSGHLYGRPTSKHWTKWWFDCSVPKIYHVHVYRLWKKMALIQKWKFLIFFLHSFECFYNFLIKYKYETGSAWIISGIGSRFTPVIKLGFKGKMLFIHKLTNEKQMAVGKQECNQSFLKCFTIH